MPVRVDPERSVTTVARRAQIVSAAIATIAELGFAKASFAQIARRAGLSSTRLISYHFAGKDDLVEAVVAEVFAVAGRFIEPYVLAESTQAGKLRAFIEASARFYAGHRQHVIAVRDIWVRFRTGDDLLRFGLHTHEPEFQVVAEIFAAGQASGEFRRFDARTMAITLRHALDGLATQVSVDPDLDVETYTRELVQTFDRATRREPGDDE
jgi:TetR/AcrR family transcriptional regulator, fatty acid metabolism regulator protein